MSTAAVETPVRAIRIDAVPIAPGCPPIATAANRCRTCRVRDLCLPSGLSADDTQQLDRLAFGSRRLIGGRVLYRAGDRFQFVYALRTGTMKTSLRLPDGREQVSGFHMSGDLLGMDGIASSTHVSSAIALEDTDLCVIPYSHLGELAALSPRLQNVVSRLMSREIVREHGLMMLLGSMNAEERLAAFLLNLSQRLKARGYSPVEFHLRMSRAEIGSYLGMKLETVSRTFSAFQQRRLLDVDKRHVRIIDLDALERTVQAQVLH